MFKVLRGSEEAGLNTALAGNYHRNHLRAGIHLVQTAFISATVASSLFELSGQTLVSFCVWIEC